MFRFLAAVMIAGAALADGIVHGVVVDETGAHVPAATVRLVIEGQTTTQHQALTNDSGDFEITNVAPGKYILRADHEGFRGRGKSVIVTDGAMTDTGRITLRISCDAPGANCEIIAVPVNTPWPMPEPEIARAGFYLRPGCNADLEKAVEDCSSASDRGDLQLERRADGSEYLKPVNHAKLSDCETRQRIDEPVRLDGLGADNEWCVETNAGHHAHLFLSGQVVEAGDNKVRLWVVTRKSSHIQ